MSEKPKKIIYWIGGNLKPSEREIEWKIHGAELQKHYEKMGGADSGYTFSWKSRCTPTQFAQIWRDPSTYGIIWYSHGEALSATLFTGYPLAYHIRIDERWRPELRGDKWDATKLDPSKLPEVSENLRFVAIMACGSRLLEKEWKKKAPRATVVTHEGPLFRLERCKWLSGECEVVVDQMTKWTTGRDGRRLFDLLPRPETRPHPGCGCSMSSRVRVFEYSTKVAGAMVRGAGPPRRVSVWIQRPAAAPGSLRWMAQGRGGASSLLGPQNSVRPQQVFPVPGSLRWMAQGRGGASSLLGPQNSVRPQQVFPVPGSLRWMAQGRGGASSLLGPQNSVRPQQVFPVPGSLRWMAQGRGGASSLLGPQNSVRPQQVFPVPGSLRWMAQGRGGASSLLGPQNSVRPQQAFPVPGSLQWMARGLGHR
jgi:hypothetical protein